MNKLLVVDDDDILREMVATVLRGAGYAVLEAQDGTEGITLARSDSPDLIICDILMGDVDGLSVLDQLRSSPGTATIPFVIMTSLSDRDSVRKGMTQGADDYLIKPFSLNDLLAAVQTQLAKHRRLVEASQKNITELRENISVAMPHEFLTPLHLILGNANILMSDSTKLTPKEIIKIGSAIGKSASRLQRLTENFLIYTQIEILAAHPEEVRQLRKNQLNESVHLLDSIARQKARIYNRLADLSTHLTETSLRILPDHLMKFMEEIVDNAFKFSEVGTPISFTSSVNSDQVTLVIADKGRGMTDEEIARLGAYQQFKRKFYEQQGIGLGLIIAKRLVELYGGKVSFKRNGKKGTIVEIVLPATTVKDEGNNKKPEPAPTKKP